MQAIQTPEAFAGTIGTFMGRDALAVAAMQLKLSATDRVLLPAYTCQEVVKPFLGRAPVVFHDVGVDLAVSPEEIQALFRQHRPKAFVLINYFGFLQPHREELKQLCLEHGVTLIEDCAHSLLTQGSGDTGDISIFSFRKHLPLPDGGGLKLNNGHYQLEATFHPQIVSNLLSILSSAKSRLKVRNSMLSRSGIESKSSTLQPSKPGSRKALPMSTFAARQMRNLDLREVVKKCREDYLTWEAQVAECESMSPVFPSLAPGVCPLGFPVRSSDRERIAGLLESAGVPIKRYWRLSAAVGKEHVSSHKLAREVFALPLFPELKPKHRVLIPRILQAETRSGHCAAHA